MMKRFAFLALILASLLATTGCGDGVMDSRVERQERYERILKNDMKQLNDDWDLFWLMDKPSRLTKHHVE